MSEMKPLSVSNKLDWHFIEPNLERARVPGGWLVRQWSQVSIKFFWPDGSGDQMDNDVISVCFIPDPDGRWV